LFVLLKMLFDVLLFIDGGRPYLFFAF
jgi:hypothetical protein